MKRCLRKPELILFIVVCQCDGHVSFYVVVISGVHCSERGEGRRKKIQVTEKHSVLENHIGNNRRKRRRKGKRERKNPFDLPNIINADEQEEEKVEAKPHFTTFLPQDQQVHLWLVGGILLSL